jgi:eukaryotic-like serine/threonine-protein kinase
MAASEAERLLAGRYRFRAVIGRGGMGAVWRARDELLNRDVAVKEIVWPSHMDPEEREIVRRRAVREAQLAARLHHPNVVRVYDIIEEDDRASIVMELVPHRSLRDTVREDGPLSPARAARVGLGVLAALRAAHDAGIVHRDVKPANIILRPEDHVVLTDFGIARAADSPALTISGVLIGSPSYTSPERARGERAGAAADLWALGASLYAAVEGRPPFERDGALASLTAIVTDEPDPPRHAGPLWPVISGLLRKDPDLRLGIAETEQMLLRVAEGGATPAWLGGDVTGRLPETDAGDRAAGTPEPDTADSAPGMQEPDTGDNSPSTPEPEGADRTPSPPEPENAAGVLSSPEPAVAAGGTAGTPEPAVAAGPATLRPSGPGPGGWRRHRTVLGALVAAAAAAVIAIAITVVAVRTPGDHRAATRAAPKASATASARTSPTAAPTLSRPSPGPSRSGSPAATAGGSQSSALPAGYYRFVNSTGFSIGVPRGWQISHVGHYVYIADPHDSGIFLLIDQSDQPKANPLTDWQQQAAARQSTYPDYHLIRLQSVVYPQAERAADWEFTYSRGGVEVQVLNRNVLANARHAYALYWTTPVSGWNAYYHYFQAFAATFRPAGASQP